MIEPDQLPKTLQQAVLYFADLDRCRDFMRAVKWPDGNPTCPACKSENVGDIATRKMLKCNDCDKQFSYTVGTVCQTHGSRCFGCGGSGMVATKLTAALLHRVQEQVAAGELESYLFEARAVAKRKAMVKGAARRFQAAWRSQPSVAADEGKGWMESSPRHSDINFYLAPRFQELGDLESLVIRGEWVKNVGFRPVSAERQAAAVARIEELIVQAQTAEADAPVVRWDEKLGKFMVVG